MEANRLLKEGIISGPSVVVADYQTYGRGQGANRWASESGQNLLMSLVLQPAFLSVERVFNLSKMVSLSLVELLAAYDLPAKIKWPNDILVGGHKICGVLLEHQIMGKRLNHSIIGIGLNLNQLNFEDFDVPATSMRKVLSITQKEESSGSGEKLFSGVPKLNRDRIESEILELIARGIQQLEEDPDSINAAYLTHLYKAGEMVELFSEAGVLKGCLKGVTESGELLVEREGIMEAYGLHTVRLKI